MARWPAATGIGRALALVLLNLLVAVRLWDPAPIEFLRLRTFDAYQVFRPRQASTDVPVMIVDIDEASLAEFGQWPWPRTLVADLVNRVAAAHAIAIGFDIVFAEPDRLSPSLMARSLHDLDPTTRAKLAELPNNDDALAKSFESLRVVLGQTAIEKPTPDRDDDLKNPTGFATLGPDPSRFLANFPGLLRNIAVLEQAAMGRGVFTITPERDGIVRRVPILMKAGGTMVPTLTLDILRVLTGAGAVMIKTDAAGIQGVKLPGLDVPTDPFGQVWVYFSPHDPDRFISAKDVITGIVDPARLANKIVLVGTSAIGLLDNKTTPIDRSMPGVEVHAQLLESAITGQNLSVPSYAVLLELVVTISVALGMVLFAPILGAIQLLLVGAAVALFLAAASWYRFSHDGVLLDATFPLVSSFLIYLTLVFTNYFREQLGRHRIRSAFGQYLSPALVEQLAQSPEKLKLGGEERVMTLMFSDVRGFTTISESFKHDPQGLTALMNRFLTPLTNAILDHKGTIDKYMGDAIMAFWNAPLDDSRQEQNGCAAALDMLRRLAAVNAERQREAEATNQPFIPLDVGVGLNTGRCVVGNMGSTLRFDYSVLGDTVNLASRLEGQSKFYGVKVVLGSATAAAVAAEFGVIEIDLIRVKGKTEPERVFSLLGDAAVRASPAFAELSAAHARMLAAYRAREWDAAESEIASCREAGRDLRIAGLYDLYDERIAEFRAEPPPPDWTGIYVALSK